MISTRDEGYYQCVASNRYGSAASDAFQLKEARVRQQPPQVTETHDVQEGDGLVLTCPAQEMSVPEGMVTWSVMESPAGGNSRAVTQDDRVNVDPSGK